MKKSKSKKQSKEIVKISKNSISGITLIALVITIIVLIILASVSIAMLTGENGIIQKAEQAKLENKRASIKEMVDLIILEEKTNNLNGTEKEILVATKEKIKQDDFKEIKKYGKQVSIEDCIEGENLFYLIVDQDKYKVTINGTAYLETIGDGEKPIKNEYIVSYNANGGSGAPENQTKVEGTDLIISSTQPTKEGYIFKGWGTSADSTTVAYNPGDTYSDNNNITLYAVWEQTTIKFNVYPPQVSFSDNGTGSVYVEIYTTTKVPANSKINFSIYVDSYAGGGQYEVLSNNTVVMVEDLSTNDTTNYTYTTTEESDIKIIVGRWLFLS